jgi:hypothetical protein
MNNNKLSNTGMLKIASKWLKLLRAGNLSPKSLSRIRSHAYNNANPYSVNSNVAYGNAAYDTALYSAPPSSFIESTFNNTVNSLKPGNQYIPFNKRPRILRDIRDDYAAANERAITNTAERKKEIQNLYTHNDWSKQRTPLDVKLEIQNLNERINRFDPKNWGLPPHQTPKIDPESLRVMGEYQKRVSNLNKINTHKVSGSFIPVEGSYYDPTIRQIGVTKSLPPDFRSQATRHEIGHAFHHLAPETFRPYVVQQTNRLVTQNPGLLPALNSKLMNENTAQLIASKGNSAGAQRFIKRYIDYGRTKELPKNVYYGKQPEGLDNVINHSLKQDPSGRSAASLVQLHRNYNLPVPLKYQYPELFNLNPYLP